MINALGKIFWGLLLTAMDLKIGSFDILPDFIGYILVARGCLGLVDFARNFLIAKRLALVLCVFSMTSYVLAGDTGFVFNLSAIVLDLLLMWFLLGGIMVIASSKGRMDMHHLAERRRREYLVASSLGTILLLLIPRGGFLTGLMSVVMFVCMAVVSCLILYLIHRMKLELDDGMAA